MDNEYICTGNRISRMSVDLVDHREGPKFHDALKGQPQIPFIRRSDRSCDHIYSDKKYGKFRTFTVSNVDRRITKCCFLSDRGFRSVWCGKNRFCMGKAFRSGFVCHRIDNI